MKCQNIPLLPVALCLMAGVIVGTSWPVGIAWAWVLPAVLILAMLLWRWKTAQSLAIAGCFVVLGMAVVQCQSERMPADETIDVVVMSEPSVKPKTIAVDLLVPDNSQLLRRYLWKDEHSLSLQLGDALTLADWRSTFVGSHDWRKGGNGLSKLSRWQRLRLFFLQLRHRLLARYRHLQADEAVYGVLAAMTLGDKSALTPDLRETYSVSGASHVLALSGLHLSIIYVLLSWLTLRRRRYWLSQVLIVASIWAFAFLTGLSASITRSATMISIYAVFSTRSRGRASLNVLCFTVIVMVLGDARSLFDVGFQLSFAAVFAILLLMPLFNRIWQPHHTLLHWAWQLAGVSLCAQLGVAPLIAYHFGRFSTYFLLTNFVVIPAATLILYGALLTLLVPQAGAVLVWIIKQLNTALGAIAELPLSSIDGLRPSVVQVVLVYVMIGAIAAITYILTSAGCRSGWPRP